MGFLDGLLNPSKHTNRGYGTARRIAGQNRDATNPYLKDLISSGTQGNSYLADLMGYGPNSQSVLQGLMDNPGYQAQRQQGMDAIDASAAMRGMSQSGDTLKALDDYGQTSFNQFRQGEINNALAQTQLGVQGVNGLNQSTSHLANLAIGQGNARDAGNQASLGNLWNIGTTLVGYGMGKPGGTGRITG